MIELFKLNSQGKILFHKKRYSTHRFTNGLIPNRTPQTSNFYDLSYYRGNKHNQGIQYPIDGSYLDPESAVKYKFVDIIKWINHFIETGKVLDVGCGPGHLAYWCQKLNKKLDIYGCDISTQLNNSKYNKNKKYQICSATDLNYKKDFFDAIFFGDILEHIMPEDSLKALNEAYRVLKPGGYVFIRIPNRVTWSLATWRDQGHVWLPNKSEIKQLLKNSNFNYVPSGYFTRGFPVSKLFYKIFKRDLRLPFFGISIYMVGKKKLL